MDIHPTAKLPLRNGRTTYLPPSLGGGIATTDNGFQLQISPFTIDTSTISQYYSGRLGGVSSYQDDTTGTYENDSGLTYTALGFRVTKEWTNDSETEARIFINNFYSGIGFTRWDTWQTSVAVCSIWAKNNNGGADYRIGYVTNAVIGSGTIASNRLVVSYAGAGAYTLDDYTIQSLGWDIDNDFDTYVTWGNIGIDARDFLFREQIVSAVGNAYTDAYNAGYNQARIDDGSFAGVLSGTFASVAEVCSIEVIPNVTLGFFILAPVVFGIIALIVKVARS